SAERAVEGYSSGRRCPAELPFRPARSRASPPGSRFLIGSCFAYLSAGSKPLRAISALDLFDSAFHVEIALGRVCVRPVEYFLEPSYGLGDGHLLAFTPGEDLSHTERLTEKPLNFPSSKDRDFVFRRKFIHAEDCDDVLQVLVALKYLLHSAGDIVMFLTDDIGCQRTGCGGKWVDRRIDPQFRNRSFQHNRGVQVRKGRCGSGIRKI